MCAANPLELICILLWGWLSADLFVFASYVPLREYAGPNFFDAWEYYNFIDNTTWGNVTYVDRGTAMSNRLTYINDAGNAVIKVDNSTFIQPAPLVHRNSIRITSHDTYGIGSLIMIDIRHIPYGCSVWPSFWTLGTEREWPGGGEIDIIEGINMLTHNQMALHTTPRCFQDINPGQTGQTIQGDCSTPQGCLVAENRPNSWGASFAQAGGGVWALQIEVAGIFVWYWSRPDVPENIITTNSTSIMDTTIWGLPSASYPASACNISEFFTPQQLVLLISLCGTWAGVPNIYASTCHTPTMSCVADNIIGPGSPTYDNAFWEISWIRTYLNNSVPPPTTSNTLIPTSSLPMTNTVGLTSVAEPTRAESSAQPSAFSMTRLLFIPLLALLGIRNL